MNAVDSRDRNVLQKQVIASNLGHERGRGDVNFGGDGRISKL